MMMMMMMMMMMVIMSQKCWQAKANRHWKGTMMYRLCSNFKASIHYRTQSYDRISGYRIWQMKSVTTYNYIRPSRTTESDNGSWIVGVEHSRWSKCVSSKRFSLRLLRLLFLEREGVGWMKGKMATQTHICKLMCRHSLAFFNWVRPFEFQNAKDTLTHCTKAPMKWTCPCTRETSPPTNQSRTARAPTKRTRGMSTKLKRLKVLMVRSRLTWAGMRREADLSNSVSWAQTY